MSFPASTKGGGQCMTFPDVCKVPAPPAPFAPAPFPNMAQCSQAKGSAKKVKIKNKSALTKKSEIPRSQGDEGGTLKGLVSAVNMDKMKYKKSSGKVKFQGAGAVTVLKTTAHNGSNSNNPAGAQIAPSQTTVLVK